MIVSKLGVVMADRNIGVNELADLIGIAPTNVTKMRTGKIKAVRFSTLDAICKVLKCQPGDVFIFVDEDEDRPLTEGNRIDSDQSEFYLMDGSD